MPEHYHPWSRNSVLTLQYFLSAVWCQFLHISLFHTYLWSCHIHSWQLHHLWEWQLVLWLLQILHETVDPWYEVRNKNNLDPIHFQIHLVWIHDIVIHFKNVIVDPRNCMKKTIKWSCNLKLSEEAGNDTSSGSSGETNLVIDNHRRHNLGSSQGLTAWKKEWLILYVILWFSGHLIMSKSASEGAAELQVGILIWTSPGNSSFNWSTTLLRVVISVTCISDSFLLTSTTFSLPPLSAMRDSQTFKNSASSLSRSAPFTSPSSAYSPIYKTTIINVS